jgi:hypothetical protein
MEEWTIRTTWQRKGDHLREGWTEWKSKKYERGKGTSRREDSERVE